MCPNLNKDPGLIGRRIYARCNFRPGKGCVDYSLHSPDGRKLAAVKSVILRDVEWRVRPRGREKAVESKVRNVHAFAIGQVVGIDLTGELGLPLEGARRVSYVPFRHQSFVWTDTEEAVTRTGYAYLGLDGAFAVL